MKYRVVLIQSDEGYAVSCPALRGCHSQGTTLEEALANIKEAIREWLAVEKQQRTQLKVTETVRADTPCLSNGEVTVTIPRNNP